MHGAPLLRPWSEYRPGTLHVLRGVHGLLPPPLTITHIDFLSVWPRASPRPAMSSHAGHATRSARRAYRPSYDSGDRRDGLSTTPLALASASTPLALCQTWPP